MRRKLKCVAVYLVCLCVILGSMCNATYSLASVSFEQGVREYKKRIFKQQSGYVFGVYRML